MKPRHTFPDSSRAVDAVDGEPFVIARAGKPLVRIVSIEVREGAEARRTGFMAGEISVPGDFDRMRSAEIEAMFEGDEVTLRDA